MDTAFIRIVSLQKNRMQIHEVTQWLENIAPLNLQENYDNAGLIIGEPGNECSGMLIALDITEEIIAETLRKNCNLIIAHHPLIFKGLKNLNNKNYIERTVIAAIKNNIAVYAIHTNLDNILTGVNFKIAEKLKLKNLRVLVPKENTLVKLATFSPASHAEQIRNALFNAGAGAIGNYDECSFSAEGNGTFKAGKNADPYVGNIGERHMEHEVKIEVIVPENRKEFVIRQLMNVHPYEDVAYDVYPLVNTRNDIGSGAIGDLTMALSEEDLLKLLKKEFNVKVIRHSSFLHKNIMKIALCGGAGSFLIAAAKAAGADAFITADIKYHEFFDASNSIFLADIGHYESEQFTIDLVADILQQKFPNFAVLKTELNTNSIKYYL
jgi:dinuclear metal center YbgI/SA1388 family protein